MEVGENRLGETKTNNGRKEWDKVLRRNTNRQLEKPTDILLQAQIEGVSMTSDQQWYGPGCRAASDAKYHAWLRYKRNPTRSKQATDHMLATQRSMMVK